VKRYIRNGNPGATRHLNNTVVLLTGQTFYQNVVCPLKTLKTQIGGRGKSKPRKGLQNLVVRRNQRDIQHLGQGDEFTVVSCAPEFKDSSSMRVLAGENGALSNTVSASVA
jgi:hypothetical protein